MPLHAGTVATLPMVITKPPGPVPMAARQSQRGSTGCGVRAWECAMGVCAFLVFRPCRGCTTHTCRVPGLETIYQLFMLHVGIDAILSWPV